MTRAQQSQIEETKSEVPGNKKRPSLANKLADSINK
jgi:hypothetical protein